MVCFSPMFLAGPTQGCLARLTCSCELVSVGLGTALLVSHQLLQSRQRKWMESKRLGLCLLCLRQGLCSLPKGVKNMKDRLPAHVETMLSYFPENRKGKCISRASGWPWCAEGAHVVGSEQRVAELVPLKQQWEMNPLLV